MKFFKQAIKYINGQTSRKRQRRSQSQPRPSVTVQEVLPPGQSYTGGLSSCTAMALIQRQARGLFVWGLAFCLASLIALDPVYSQDDMTPDVSDAPRVSSPEVEDPQTTIGVTPESDSDESTAGDPPAEQGSAPEKLTTPDGMPWQASDGGAAPIARRPQRPLEMLRYFDVDESVMRNFIDGRGIAPDEQESLINILYALPQFSDEDRQRWSAVDVPWQTLAEEPEEHRTEMYRVTGRVRRIEPVALIPEQAERFSFRRYYRATVELLNNKTTLIVFARTIPKDWEVGRPIDETVSFNGMFLKWGEEDMMWATDRIAWHPNKVDADRGITREHVFLGDLGMDLGLWDQVIDREPLKGRERETFYQLMAAVGRTKQSHLRARAADDARIVDMLRRPKDFHGRLLTIEGTARRAAKVMVGDKDVQARFGIDHYYEIYVFVKPEKIIVYGEGDDQVRFDTYPVVFCCRELPPGMPEGDNIHVGVSIPGFFLKAWEYDTKAITAREGTQGQISPMLVALRPDILDPNPNAMSPYTGAMVGGLFIAAIIGVWIGVWSFSREDKKFERETLSRQRGLMEGESLNEMGIDAEGPPNFEFLGKEDYQPKENGDSGGEDDVTSDQPSAEEKRENLDTPPEAL